MCNYTVIDLFKTIPKSKTTEEKAPYIILASQRYGLTPFQGFLRVKSKIIASSLEENIKKEKIFKSSKAHRSINEFYAILKQF